MANRNVLLILTDQERDVGPWDPPELARFRAALPHRARRRAEARRYARHRIASAACVPSRVSLLTGRSPWAHGVTQTDGMAKLATDPAMRWLPPDRAPTLGHRVRAAGGEAVYIGKWHLSHPADGDLAPWGFTGWTGPEPHGPDPANSGVARDPGFVTAACRWLERRGECADAPPFLLVVSLVNPHDIVFWPAWSLWGRGRLDLGGVPPVGPGPTDHHRPSGEPSTLAAYRERYPSAYAPAGITRLLYGLTPDRYRRFYASLLRRTDRHIGALLAALREAGLARATDVLLTSDHGELLGAHGGLHQKFYNAFEETLRVPLWVRRADGAGAGSVCDHPSTHLDIVPTVLAAMGAPVEAGPAGAPPLPGRDLSTLDGDRPSYFVTQDDILGGESQTALVGRAAPLLGRLLPLPYGPFPARNRAVEAVVVEGTTLGAAPGPWKLIRYFDPEHPAPSGADEWSLFHLGADPCERHDRAADPEAAPWMAALRRALASARGALGGPARAAPGAQPPGARSPG